MTSPSDAAPAAPDLRSDPNSDVRLDVRLEQARRWLSTLPVAAPYGPPVPASADASFRRYFRLERTGRPGPDGPAAHSLILMDAPPEREPLDPFLRVQGLLADAGLHVPQCLARNTDEGFLLLEDLGTTDLQAVLKPAGAAQASPAQAWAAYRPALQSLVQMQAHGLAHPKSLERAGIPAFGPEKIAAELALFPDWYVQGLRRTQLTAAEQTQWKALVDHLCHRLPAMAQVLVHRDYHCRNLMVAPNALDQPPGVIDFQDAVVGPITYDLVSLLRDAYIDWPEAEQLDWVIRTWEMSRAAGLPVPADATEFYEDFEWVGLQRHLKVLGIFARLSIRDGKHRYLADIPRVMQYTRKVCERYSRLTPLLRILDRVDGIATEVRTTF